MSLNEGIHVQLPELIYYTATAQSMLMSVHKLMASHRGAGSMGRRYHQEAINGPLAMGRK
jgi:hypothetical protein